MEWLLKVLPFLRKWIDKEFEKYLRKKFDEQTDIRSQMDALKAVLVKEVEEKQFWKQEVNRVVYSERKNTVEMIEKLIPMAVSSTIDTLREHYILIPKNRMSKYGQALLPALEDRIAVRPIGKDT